MLHPSTPETASKGEASSISSSEALAWEEEIDDASPFDAVSGVGFDSHPVARAIEPHFAKHPRQ